MDSIEKEPGYDVLFVDEPDLPYTDNPYPDTTYRATSDDDGYVISRCNPVFQEFTLIEGVFISSVSWWMTAYNSNFPDDPAIVRVVVGAKDSDTLPYWGAGQPLVDTVVTVPSMGLNTVVQKITVAVNQYLPAGKYVFGLIPDPESVQTLYGFSEKSIYSEPTYTNAGELEYYGFTYRLCFELRTYTGDNLPESLPLMLTEGGALALQKAYTSPFSGQLAQGTLTEQDLSTYRARTQNDWSGGRALEAAPGPTNRYHDADVDARFKEMLVLAPRMIKAAMPATGPSFLPSDGNTHTSSATVQAYNAATLLDVPQFKEDAANVVISDAFGTDGLNRPRKLRAMWEATRFARYLPGDKPSQTISTQRAYLSYTESAVEIRQPQDGWFNTGNISSEARYAENGRMLAQGVIVSDTQYEPYGNQSPRTLTHVQIEIRTITPGASGIGTLEIRSDAFPATWNNKDQGAPTGTILASGTFTLPAAGGALAWVTVALSADVALVSGTKYWIVLRTAGDGAKVVWQSYADVTQNKALYGGHPTANAWYDYRDGSGAVMHYQHAFKLSNGIAYTNGVGRDVAQAVVIGGDDIDVDRVRMRLKRESWAGAFVAKLELRTELNGQPNADDLIKEWEISSSTLTTSMAWVEFTMTEATLLADTTYWLILRVGSMQTDDGRDVASIAWECDSSGRYDVEDSYAAQRLRAAGSNTAWVELANTDMFFAIENKVLSATKIAQSVTLGADDVTLSQVQLRVNLASLEDWTGNGVVYVYVRADDTDEPHASTIMAQGGLTRQSVINAAAVGSPKWVTVPMTNLATPLVAGTKYWITIEGVAAAAADAVTLAIYNDQNQQYPSGKAMWALYEDDAWGDWTEAFADAFFILNSGPVQTGAPVYTATRLARQFVTPVGGLTVTKISLLMELSALTGTPTVSLKICADDTDEPDLDTVVATAAISPSSLTLAQTWLTVPIAATLDEETAYWIVVEATSAATQHAFRARWYGDLNGVDTSALALQAQWQGAAWLGWQECMDLYYIVNDGDSFDTDVTVHPVVFGTGLYLAAGLKVYKFNNSTQVWDALATFTGTAVVTAMAEYGGKLWCARGDSAYVRTYDGTSWADTAVQFTHLLNYNGYLNAAKAAGGAGAFGYYNGTDWTTVALATSSLKITGLLGYQSRFLITTEVGIWEQSSDFVQQMLDYQQQRSSGNGVNPIVWIGDGLAYIPIRHGLNAWNLAGMRPSGLDLDEGLPAGWQGPVSAMVGTPSWLFAAVDAGASGYSGVYAKTVEGGGWHRLMAAPFPGKRIRAIAFEAVTHASGIPRLWAMLGAEAWYVELPDYSNNRYTYTGSEYQTSGSLISAWWGGELSQIAKDFQQISIKSTGCRPGCSVDVYIEVDRSGYWTHCGTVTRSPYQMLQLRTSAIVPKVIGEGSTDQTIVIDIVRSARVYVAGSSGQEDLVNADNSILDDLRPGTFIRIGAEVAQVASVGVGEITLAMPLQNGAPAAGSKLYGSSPGGREMRYKLVFKTDTPTDTPCVQGVTLRYQDQILGNARYSFTVRIEDNMRMRNGGEYPYTAAELRELLDDWIKRLTPFRMVLPDSTGKRVKMLNANESDFTRDTLPDAGLSLRSRMTFGVIEV
jgi:hypothetical protein